MLANGLYSDSVQCLPSNARNEYQSIHQTYATLQALRVADENFNLNENAMKEEGSCILM